MSSTTNVLDLNRQCHECGGIVDEETGALSGGFWKCNSCLRSHDEED